jgi:hypothetical protein
MMKFSNWKTMVALTIAWAAACYGADFLLHPRPVGEFFNNKHEDLSKYSKPHITIWMNHLCCSGCVSDVNKALATLPWVGPVTVGNPVSDMDDANKKGEGGVQPLDGARNKIDFDITDVKLADLEQLDRTIRDTGLTADRIDLKGIPHFRVEAEFKHVCCSLCVKGLDDGMNVARNLKASGQFGWIDSITVSKMGKTLTAHARYDSVVEVEELLAGLNRLGFQPNALRILVGEET